MKIGRIFQPRPTLSEQEVKSGLRQFDLPPKTIEAAKEVAAQVGLSEDEVTAQTVEGALQAAEAIGPEEVAQVAEAVPEEMLPSETKELEHSGC